MLIVIFHTYIPQAKNLLISYFMVFLHSLIFEINFEINNRFNGLLKTQTYARRQINRFNVI